MPSRRRLASIAVKMALRDRPPPFGPLAHREEHLGGDHDFVAPRKILERLSDDFLGGAVRIGIGGVEKIDAQIDGLADQRPALALGKAPGMIPAFGNAEGHAAETQWGDFKAGAAKISYIAWQHFIKLNRSLKDN